MFLMCRSIQWNQPAESSERMSLNVLSEVHYGKVGKLRESIKSDYTAARNLQDNFQIFKEWLHGVYRMEWASEWECWWMCMCLHLSSFPPSLQRVKHKSQPLSWDSNGRPMAVYGKRDKTIHFSIQQQYYNIAYKKHQRALTHPLWKMRCTYFRKRIATSAITRAHSACSNVSICSTRAVMFLFPSSSPLQCISCAWLNW